LEQRRGAVIAMLSKYAHLTIYPIHPSTLANYRQSFYPSGAKSDPGDARLQLELLARHRDRLQVLKPDTVETRTLQFLVEHRRKLVDDRTAYSNQLTAWLKQIYPQILRWFDDPAAPMVGQFLARWPTLEQLRRARPATIREFFRQHHSGSAERIEQRLAELARAVSATHDAALLQAGARAVTDLLALLAALRQAIARCDEQIRQTAEAHPDFAIVRSFPGAGPVLAPRLLAALGTQRDRFGSASDLQAYTGIAPVVVRSGQHELIHRRWACPKFVRQTLHEWAGHSRKKCAWAQQYYEQQRGRGKSHHAALRALAFKWIRILFRCWQNHTPYVESRYLAARAQRAPTKSEPTPAVLRVEWKSVAGFWRAGRNPA
jgi:transposase